MNHAYGIHEPGGYRIYTGINPGSKKLAMPTAFFTKQIEVLSNLGDFSVYALLEYGLKL